MVSSSNSFLAFALPLISCSRITNKIATATWLQWGWQTCDNTWQATMTLVAVAGDIVTIMWLYQWAPDYWAWLTFNWYLDQHELLDVLEDLKTPWHYTTWDMKIGNHLINILDSRLRSQTNHCKQELLFYWWAVISDQHQQVSRRNFKIQQGTITIDVLGVQNSVIPSGWTQSTDCKIGPTVSQHSSSHTPGSRASLQDGTGAT